LTQGYQIRRAFILRLTDACFLSAFKLVSMNTIKALESPQGATPLCGSISLGVPVEGAPDGVSSSSPQGRYPSDNSLPPTPKGWYSYNISFLPTSPEPKSSPVSVNEPEERKKSREWAEL